MNAQAMQIGLYGKIPSQGDFVRVNASEQVTLQFDQWMQEGLESVYRANAQVPAEPTYFLFRAPNIPQVMVGVFAPSHDSVGRRFPLVVFAMLDAAMLAQRFSSVPVVFGNFLSSAYSLIESAPQMDASTLRDRLLTGSVPLPSPADFTQGDMVCQQTLDMTPSADVIQRLFGEGIPGGAVYAFRTFLDACAGAVGKEPAKANVIIECPIASDVDLFTWLEIARRSLRWTAAPPSFLWSEGETPKVMISLGPPPPQLLMYQFKPDHNAQKVWPVITTRPDAVGMARNALKPHQLGAIEQPTHSLGTLVSSLTT